MSSRTCKFQFSVTAVILAFCALSWTPSLPAQGRPETTNTNDVTALIREEGLNHSQVMETLSYLTEVVGPRLTGSRSHKRANEWTRSQMSCWGLTNAHLEAWGPFGRGWSLKRFSAQVIEPQCIPLIACPKAWSPGLEKTLMADVVLLESSDAADLEKCKGTLKGAIVLSGRVRDLKPRFEPLATRFNETNLLRLANAAAPRSSTSRSGATPAPRRNVEPGSDVRTSDRENGQAQRTATTNEPALSSGSTNRVAPPPGRGGFSPRLLSFFAKEGAALVVTPSAMGDGGTLFVGSASIPGSESGTNRFSFTNNPRAWSTNAPATLPQITVATEDYNRMVRMIQHGERLKMAVDFQVDFEDTDLMAYNTVAEIPGTDLKDEIVMVGGHLDSWHAGTGAADDAVGVAAAMEAVRILKTLKLAPRRTIRVGLWAGEEQGLLGSKAYVARHFGYWTNTAAADRKALRSPKDISVETTAAKSAPTTSDSRRKLVRLAEYEKLSAYFNLDNGGGKIRGIYLQGNEALRPLFRRWLEPLRDLDAETITVSNTSGTDHLSFDAIGLPGFQFIQDPLDYNTRVHHANQDVLDRLQPEDVKQAATILAVFVYNTAMLDERLPRKAVND